MPIVSIQCVETETSGDDSAAPVQALADRLGDIFGSPPGSTWVKISRLSQADYAENHATLDAEVQPTFVEILRRTLDDEATLAKEAMAVSVCVAEALNRPHENVHVIYLPPGTGRVAFGGRLITEES